MLRLVLKPAELDIREKPGKVGELREEKISGNFVIHNDAFLKKCFMTN